MGQVVSVIQQFLHPPLGLTQLEALPANPYTGLNGFQRVRGPINVAAFGFRWTVTGFPAGYGVTPAAGDNVFDRPIIDIAIVHQLFDSSLVVSEQATFRTAAGHLMFTESLPYIVDVELAPGIEANFFWMIVL